MLAQPHLRKGGKRATVTRAHVWFHLRRLHPVRIVQIVIDHVRQPVVGAGKTIPRQPYPRIGYLALDRVRPFLALDFARGTMMGGPEQPAFLLLVLLVDLGRNFDENARQDDIVWSAGVAGRLLRDGGKVGRRWCVRIRRRAGRIVQR